MKVCCLLGPPGSEEKISSAGCPPQMPRSGIRVNKTSRTASRYAGLLASSYQRPDGELIPSASVPQVHSDLGSWKQSKPRARVVPRGWLHSRRDAQSICFCEWLSNNLPAFAFGMSGAGSDTAPSDAADLVWNHKVVTSSTSLSKL